MSDSRFAAVRSRLDPTEVGGAAVFFAVLYGLGFDEAALAALIGVVIGVPMFEALFDSLGVGRTSAGLGFGVVVCLAGGSLLVRDGGSTALGGVLVLAGCWVVLDVLHRRRRGDPIEADQEGDVSDTELLARMEHVRWVIEALREADQPLTREELRDRTGLTDAELDAALTVPREEGAVERVGNGYVVDERELGHAAFIRNAVRRVGGRLLRPFRVLRPRR